MKTFFPHLMIITTLIGLTGCGSKSVGKLEVSQSFATTNTSFGGGLVISGKHLSSGRTFSQSILSGKEMKINLEQGTWKISAVGWDGGGLPGNEKIFAGNPFCGTIIANLASSGTVVDLNINQANCNALEFSKGHISGGNLKVFGAVITCNTFFVPTININNPIATQIIGPGVATDNFCEEAALDPDLKSRVKAVKIYANNKLPDQAAPALGLNTGCMQGTSGFESKILPTNAANPYNGYTLKLPFNNLPLTVVTFEDTSCLKPLATFHFKDGLAEGSDNFDHLLQNRGSSDMKLVLPANDLKRAKSALIGLLPSIKRFNNGTPAKYITQPSNLASLTLPAIAGENHEVQVNEEDCGTNIVTSGAIADFVCEDTGKQIEFHYKGGSDPGPASIVIYDGGVVRRTFTLDVKAPDTIFTSLMYDSQARVMELLGHEGSSNSNFFGLDDKDKDTYGVLSDVRHMFSPDGAGGVLGLGNADPSTTFKEACENLDEDKTKTIYNESEMAFETYRVDIHNAVVSSPSNFMCKTNSLSTTNTNCLPENGGIIYDKRMTFFDHKESLFAPVFVMEFSCSSLVGRFESRRVKVQGISRHTNKKIVTWNTNPDSSLEFQRMEVLKIIKRERFNLSSWITMAERRNMSRIQKISAEEFSAFNYHFETVWDSLLSTYRQKARALFLQSQASGTNLAFRHSPASGSNPTDPFSILAVQGGSPPTNPILDKFTMNAAYNSGRAGSSVAMTLLPTLNNADKIDGVLPFQLLSLGTMTFTNSFGSSFYTDP